MVATTNAAAISEAKANLGMMGFRKRAPAQVATGWAAQVQDKTTGSAATNRRLPIRRDPVHPDDDAGTAVRTKIVDESNAAVCFRFDLPEMGYACSIDATTPINAASHSSPAATACTKKPVSRFSAASV